MEKKPVKYYVVDAFTDTAFKGNPAVVCLLDQEGRDDRWLQSVAAEFNIPTTGFLTRVDDSSFRLRWFTPVAEVNLCGHATLAASHALFANGLVKSERIEFDTQSGTLTAKKIPENTKKNRDASSIQNSEQRESYLIELDFPTVSIVDANSVDIALISKALGGVLIVDIKRTTTADDLIVVLQSSRVVKELQPRFDEVLKCPGRGIIVTGAAPLDSGFDFYSRFFCPRFGVNEDPVCGSAHCALVLYWSIKLGKCDFTAYQASRRSGILNIHFDEQNQRVLLRGQATTVMEGSILV